MASKRMGTPQHFDAHHSTGSAIICHVKNRLHLNHVTLRSQKVDYSITTAVLFPKFEQVAKFWS